VLPEFVRHALQSILSVPAVIVRKSHHIARNVLETTIARTRETRHRAKEQNGEFCRILTNERFQCTLRSLINNNYFKVGVRLSLQIFQEFPEFVYPA
jgi:hypothetical protein